MEAQSILNPELVPEALPMNPRFPPVRLAYLVSEYPAVSHTFILREVKRLRVMNFDVSVASINSPGRSPAELANEERQEAATTFYIKKAGAAGAFRAHLRAVTTKPAGYLRGFLFACALGEANLRQLIYALLYFTEAVILGNWMADRGLSHVHVHFANPAATVGLLASRIFAVGFSFTVHGPEEFYDVRGQRLSQKIDSAAFVICIGYFARSQLMKISPARHWCKFDIAPLGVDLEVFRNTASRQSAAPFQILCVGRLVPAKGQHILVAAVDRLIKRGRSINLRLVGDGPDRASLEREVQALGLKGFITFEGNVNQDRIGLFYREADAFVLASFAEGIPVVLMEAMAMELPCVSTMIAGIPELIRDGIDGLLVMPSDERGLAEAIERLIDDEALRRRLGQAGRRRVAEKYDLNTNMKLLAQVFRKRLGCISYSPATAAQRELL
ncbi:MAG TPA: glycosyltransferase family 4 protein [Candidatus Binataceae bacterium]|nr:glycosyltransferase family 4 protein [Candidatus Binataceae bacterium]